jgi:hypothetical protein
MFQIPVLVELSPNTYQVGFLTAAKPDSGMCQACKASLRPMAGIKYAAKKPTLIIQGVVGLSVVVLADSVLAH